MDLAPERQMAPTVNYPRADGDQLLTLCSQQPLLELLGVVQFRLLAEGGLSDRTRTMTAFGKWADIGTRFML